MANAPENVTLELDLKVKVDKAMADALATLKKFDAQIQSTAREINKTNAEFAKSQNVEAWRVKMEALGGQLGKTSQKLNDAENSMESWRAELARQQSILATLPAKINEVSTSINRMKAAGQTTGPAWQLMNAEMARLVDQQRKLDAASKGTTDSFRQIRFGAQNAAYQVTDFFVSIQSGTSGMRAFAQQAPQFLSAFGTFGIFAGLAVSVGTALYQMGTAASESASKVGEAVDALDALKNIGGSVNVMTDELAKAFNKMGKEAKSAAIDTVYLAQGQAVLNYANAVKKAQDEAAGLYESQMSVAKSMELVSKMGQQSTQTTLPYADEFGAADEQAAQFLITMRELQKELKLPSLQAATDVAKTLQDLKTGAITTEQAIRKLRAQLEFNQTNINFLKALSDDAGEANKSLEIIRQTAELISKMETGHLVTTDDKKTMEDLLDAQRAYAKSVAEGNAKLLTDAIALSDVKKTELQQLQELLNSYTHLDAGVKAYVQTQIDLAKAAENMIHWSDLLIDASKRYEDLEVRTTEEMMKEADALDKLADKYLGLINPQNSLQDEYHELFTLANEGRITWEEYAKALKVVEDKSNKLNDSMEAFGTKLAQNISGTVDDMIDNFGKATMSFSDFAESFMKDTAKMISQILIMEPLARSMREWFGGFNSPGDLWGSIFGSAHGNQFQRGTSLPQGVYTAPTFFKFANGGIPGRTGVLAEAGRPEAIVPLIRHGKDLGVSASPVVVNVHNNAQAEVSVQQETGPDGATILNVMVERKVREMLGRGNLDRQMMIQYGITRQPA